MYQGFVCPNLDISIISITFISWSNEQSDFVPSNMVFGWTSLCNYYKFLIKIIEADNIVYYTYLSVNAKGHAACIISNNGFVD